MFPEIPEYYKRVLRGAEDEIFVSRLIGYVVYNIKPNFSPAIWQDAMKYIRMRKRDVWALDNETMEFAIEAITSYRIKFLGERLGKEGVLELLNKLFSGENMWSKVRNIDQIIEAKLHAPLDSFIFVQEKRIVAKEDLKDFDKLFEYPCWLEFDKEARQEIYKRILDGALTDEQIDYYLGTSEKHEHYVELYPVVKHVLKTTNNPHTFWTAGDVLNLIWITAPEEMNGWFKDEIFSIFWPRVGNVWPIAHRGEIREMRESILTDSIGWLMSLNDIKERLPELKGAKLDTPNEMKDEFNIVAKRLEHVVTRLDEFDGAMMRDFCLLVNTACEEEEVGRLVKICEQIKEKYKKTADGRDLESVVTAAQKKAERGLKDMLREREDIGKNLTRVVESSEEK